MRGEEDRDAVVAREIDQRSPEGVAGDRIDARRGLVENQHVRPVETADRQLKPLADAERQLSGRLIRHRDQVEAVEQLPRCGAYDLAAGKW